jgi:signal transduction histidine kinase
MPPGRATAAARAILSGAVEEIEDVTADLDYQHADIAKIITFRSIVAVPMIKDSRPIGAIAMARSQTGKFPEQQIELLHTFADQAVIAIENTRPFEAEQSSKRELQESLEYQTATTEVLDVISRSPTNSQPVLDTIAVSIRRLSGSTHGSVFLFHGGQIHLASHAGLEPAAAQVLAQSFPQVPGRGSATARALLSRQVAYIPDVLADDEYGKGDVARAVGYRSIVSVPMLRDGHPVGAITATAAKPAEFSERQIALLQTFANQAVIAINNAGLFEEVQARTRDLTESLEQQTATADVLKVISRSALDVQKVLDALVESAARLCTAYDAAIFQVVGDSLRLVAHHGQIPMTAPVGQLTVPLVRGIIGGRAVIERRTIQVTDMLAEGDEYPEGRKRALQVGSRTALAVPLVHAGEAIGVILIRRAQVRPFGQRQIELVNTFADQAVIAIENTRLFEEVQERTRELAKTVEDLEIASQHKNQFVANMSHELRTPLAAILGYAELIQEGFYEPQGPKSLDALTRIRSNGKHLLGLINTVLDIAKIESGQFTLNMTEYAIESVVETVRAATESLAQNKKLTLTTSVDKPLPIGLGDEQRLTQVLLNLVGNAIKFTDTGEVRITAKATNGHFNISVPDTGPGIPPEHQTRIFEQFRQVDNSNTRAKGGTGLGLAIAKQIVEMHGGRIWVVSTVGKGATFQMEIPARAQVAKSA